MDLSILVPEISVIEKIIRPLVVYFFLLLAFRITGKRELGQMTPFDLIVLLTISNILQNAMIGADNSLGGGLIGAATLFLANGILARLTFYFPGLARLVEGKPTLLIENGRVLVGNLRREAMSMDELEGALRKQGLELAAALPMVKQAMLEQDGSVSVIRKEGSE